MTKRPTSTEAEGELRALRERAYGPNPDIQDDLVALARLSELESARLATEVTFTSVDPAADAESAVADSRTTEPSAGEPSRSVWRRAASTRSGRLWLVAGTLALGLAFSWAVVWLLTPRPDAALAPSGVMADGQILNIINRVRFAPIAQIDTSTLRGYEAYRGIELWFAENAEGFECFLAIERASESLIAGNCAPPEAGLRLEIGGYPEADEIHYEDGLPAGSVIRFTLSGHWVDVDLFPSSAAE